MSFSTHSPRFSVSRSHSLYCPSLAHPFILPPIFALTPSPLFLFLFFLFNLSFTVPFHPTLRWRRRCLPPPCTVHLCPLSSGTRRAASHTPLVLCQLEAEPGSLSFMPPPPSSTLGFPHLFFPLDSRSSALSLPQVFYSTASPVPLATAMIALRLPSSLIPAPLAPLWRQT